MKKKTLVTLPCSTAGAVVVTDGPGRLTAVVTPIGVDIKNVISNFLSELLIKNEGGPMMRRGPTAFPICEAAVQQLRHDGNEIYKRRIEQD